MPKYTQPPPLVFPQPFSKCVTVMSNTLQSSSFKNSHIYIEPVHEDVGKPRHHFRESEFTPLAAAAAASLAVRKTKERSAAHSAQTSVQSDCI